MKSSGWGMIAIGWIIAFLTMSIFFGYVLDKRHNPNRLSVLTGKDEIVLKINDQGHYLMEGHLNENVVNFLLDTGATQMAIPGEMADRMNLPYLQSHLVGTAAGNAWAAQTTIESLQIGPFLFKDINALIVPDMRGDTVLLGMNVLKHIKFIQEQDTLRLLRPQEK